MLTSTARVADVVCALLIVAFAVSVILIFSLRAAVRAGAHYARVDKQGSSRLLGKREMEMIYWSLQALGRGFARAGFTPNAVSYLSLLTGLGAGVALGFGFFGVAALCGLLSGFLDILDGMVARATGVSSDAGEVLDATIDRYTEYAFFGGLLIYYRAYPALMVLTLIAMVGASMVTYSTAKAEALHVAVPSAMMRRHERSTYLVGGACLASFTAATFETSWSYRPELGVPLLAVVVLIAVLGNVAAVRRMRAIAQAVRRREASAA